MSTQRQRLAVERRTQRPLFPPHVKKLQALVSGTTVMLGVTGSSSEPSSSVPSSCRPCRATPPSAPASPSSASRWPSWSAPSAPDTCSPTSVPARSRPPVVLVLGASLLLARTPQDAGFAVDLLPGLVGLGVGVGMVFVPVSVSSMAGIPHSHAGVASGFLMTGHEVGAALGVAVLSAVASTAGSLVTPDGAADAFGRGFLAAAVMAGVFAVVALVRMPAARVEAATAGLHMH